MKLFILSCLLFASALAQTDFATLLKPKYGKPEDLACIIEHCTTQMTACYLDKECRPAFICDTKCDLSDPSCGFECLIALGQKSEKYGRFLQCLLKYHCIPSYNPDTCHVNMTSDGVQNLTKPEDFLNSWWVVRGLNPIYDAYPCQHNDFKMGYNGKAVVNNVSWTDQYGEKPFYIDVMPNISVPYPGVSALDYPNDLWINHHEYWTAVSRPHPDWMFMIWCGGNDIVQIAGAILLSTNKNMDNIPKSINDTFREEAKKHGIDYDNEMFPMVNDACEN